MFEISFFYICVDRVLKVDEPLNFQNQKKHEDQRMELFSVE